MYKSKVLFGTCRPP